MNNDILTKAIALRHEIHQNPDLSNMERPTLERVIQFISDNTKLKIVDRGHYIYAVYRSKSQGNPNIAFRADCDAIMVEDSIDKPYRSIKPGIGHKCGHDGHTASLAALALEVDREGADRDVYFLFQPAEENGSGAKSCLDFIKENDIAEIYAAHGHGTYYPDDTITSKYGVIQCASKGMIITMTGSPAHAANPENGKNPIFALSQLALDTRTLVARPYYQDYVLATVVQMDVGERESFGVMASKGRLLLTIRGGIESELDDLQRNIEAAALKYAKDEGLRCEFEYKDEFPETRNHKESVDKVKRACDLLNYKYYETPVARRGSEDFGYYLKQTKGAIYYCSFGEKYPAIHTSAYDFDDNGIERIVNLNKALIKDMGIEV
ncbi:MAG: amidohydrolase [Clostridia bacterium]|nr:amidohydrolase [Clostridia bacterium]